MKRFRPEDIDNAVDQFDESRRNGENLGSMLDRLAQFTGPLSTEEQRDAEFALNDELARRRSMKFDPGI
jgi:hypothetical protein